MLKKVDHIGIAVADLDQAILLYETLLGTPCFKIENVGTENVRTAFFQLDGLKIELVCSAAGGSAISTFIEKRGEGIHHIAFLVPDILAESERLAADGFTLLNKAPSRGADNKDINFLHPAGTGRVLVEVCAERN